MEIFVLTAVAAFLFCWLVLRPLVRQPRPGAARFWRLRYIGFILLCGLGVFLLVMIAIWLISALMFPGETIEGLTTLTTSPRSTRFIFGIMFGLLCFYWSMFLIRPAFLREEYMRKLHYTWAALLALLFLVGVSYPYLQTLLQRITIKTPAFEITVVQSQVRGAEPPKQLQIASTDNTPSVTGFRSLQQLISLPLRIRDHTKKEVMMGSFGEDDRRVPALGRLASYVDGGLSALAKCVDVARKNQVDRESVRDELRPVAVALTRLLRAHRSAHAASYEVLEDGFWEALRRAHQSIGVLLQTSYVDPAPECERAKHEVLSPQDLNDALNGPYLHAAAAALQDLTGNPEAAILILEDKAKGLQEKSGSNEDRLNTIAGLSLVAYMATLYSNITKSGEDNPLFHIRALETGRGIATALERKAKEKFGLVEQDPQQGPDRKIEYKKWYTWYWYYKKSLDNDYAYYVAQQQIAGRKEIAGREEEVTKIAEEIERDEVEKNLRVIFDRDNATWLRAAFLDTAGFVRLAYAATGRARGDSDPVSVRNEIDKASRLFERAIVLIDSRVRNAQTDVETNWKVQDYLWKKEDAVIAQAHEFERHRDLARSLLSP